MLSQLFLGQDQQVGHFSCMVCCKVPAQPGGPPSHQGRDEADGREGLAGPGHRHLCLLRAPGCWWLGPVLEAQERAQRAESRHGSEVGTGRARREEAWVLPRQPSRPGSWPGRSRRLHGICAFGHPRGPPDTYCVQGRRAFVGPMRRSRTNDDKIRAVLGGDERRRQEGRGCEWRDEGPPLKWGED